MADAGTIVLIVSAILAGGGVSLAAWMQADRIAARWQRDVAWTRQMVFRFSPRSVNAEACVTAWYMIMPVLLAVLMLVIPGVVLALAIWLTVWMAPRHVAEIAWQMRRRRIDAQLPPAIAALANSVQAGFTLVQAIQRAAHTAPQPVRTEFIIMRNRYELGADLQATLEEARDRLKLRNFDLFVSALLVNRELGGNLTQTLNRIAQALEAVDLMHKRVKAATSAGRTNILVLGLAPLVILLLLRFIDDEAVGMLFTQTVGHILLVIAGAMTATGVFWASRIVQADV